VSVGTQHTMFLCDHVKGRHGVLFGCGDNTHGQLGIITEHLHPPSPPSPLSDIRKIPKRLMRPTQVTALASVNVRKVACGNMHTVVATDTGDLYTWGANDGGNVRQMMRWWSVLDMFDHTCTLS
jgi:alpha-tubulin suppressor-like RCC1 family protein